VRLGMKERTEGFTRALAAAGVGEDALSVVHASENTVEAGARAVRSLLEGNAGRRPTAVFTVTDVLALGVLECAAQVGLAVPGDLSLVGFDDIVEARRSRPALTTVSQSLYEQGRHAGRLALALVAGEPARSPRFTAELVVRDSTSTAPNARRRRPSTLTRGAGNVMSG